MTTPLLDSLDALNHARVINLLDPTAAQDASTKNYVDTTALPRAHAEVTLTADTAWCSQVGGVPVLSGSFTPRGTSGLLTITTAGWNFGVALAGFFLLYGTGAFPLYQAASNVGAINPATGVTLKKLGGVGVDLTANFGRTIPLTGLTPATPINWTVGLGIACGLTKLNLPGAYRMCVTPDRTKAYVGDYTNNQVHVINLGGTQGFTYYRSELAQPGDTTRGFSYGHAYKCTIPMGGTGSGPFGPAITPDGTKVVVANYNGTVTVINTATETVQGTYTCPGTTPHPYSAVCPNNTTAYIVDNHNNVVYPFTIATGAFGTGITVGTGPQFACSTPNGAEVYVPNFGSSATQNSVSVISTATNTVTNTVVLFNNGVNTISPYECAAAQDGASVWVITQGAAANGGQRLYQILTATHVVGVVSDPTPFTGTNFQAISIDGSTNGRTGNAAIPPVTAWAFTADGHAVQYWVATPAPQGGGGGAYAGKVFTTNSVGSNITGSFIDNWGNIYFCDFAGTPGMLNWPGGKHEILPTGAGTFADHFLTVDWQDAA